jgi:quercetin dioxygenase-like cupin family protein
VWLVFLTLIFMEAVMMRKIALVMILAAFGIAAANAEQSATVDTKGSHGKVKIDQLVAGHLMELNGRYKLRLTEVTYEPGGYTNAHHHVGPGIRCITAGELTFTEGAKTTLYHAGDCFFEPGDVSHSARNDSAKPVVILNFELLPPTWSKGSAIPVPK